MHVLFCVSAYCIAYGDIIFDARFAARTSDFGPKPSLVSALRARNCAPNFAPGKIVFRHKFAGSEFGRTSVRP
jgi:hypothetical protein